MLLFLLQAVQAATFAEGPARGGLESGDMYHTAPIL
jgi:hypothetical protein